MKILIIGGSGVIGSHLVRSCIKENSVIYTYHKNKQYYHGGIELDIRNRDNTIKLLKKIKPELVIIASALANVDLCKTNTSLAKSINVKGIQNITDGCKMVNSKLIFISTSAVFD